MIGIAAQTRIAIGHAAAMTDDKRKLVIIGNADAIDELKRTGAEYWKELPSCFRPIRQTAWTFVGSFDGVPVGEMVEGPAVDLGIVLGDSVIAGVTRFREEGLFTSWHVVNGRTVLHSERCRLGLLQ